MAGRRRLFYCVPDRAAVIHGGNGSSDAVDYSNYNLVDNTHASLKIDLGDPDRPVEEYPCPDDGAVHPNDTEPFCTSGASYTCRWMNRAMAAWVLKDQLYNITVAIGSPVDDEIYLPVNAAGVAYGSKGNDRMYDRFGGGQLNGDEGDDELYGATGEAVSGYSNGGWCRQ